MVLKNLQNFPMSLYSHSKNKNKRHILLDFMKPNFWFGRYQQACLKDFFSSESILFLHITKGV